MNWPLIIALFCLCIPGVLLAIPRLIHVLLPNNSAELKQRLSRLAIFQNFFMIFIMCLGGAVFSPYTGLNAPIIEAMLTGQPWWLAFQTILLPVIIYALFAFVILWFFYYGLLARFVDPQSFSKLRQLHQTLKMDACVLYGGVVEEIIARWGIANLVVMFAILFARQKTPLIICSALFISGLLFSISQLPVYFAAGCQKSRRFAATILLMHSSLAMVFGILFWQWGLLAAMLSHMLFHVLWASYDKRLPATIP